MVSRKKKDLFRLAGVVIGAIVLNWLSSTTFTRIDFTAEKRYSLSEVSKKTLRELPDNLDVVVYLDGDFPAGLKRLQHSVKDLLGNMKAYAGGKLTFDFVDPFSRKYQSSGFVDQLYEKLSALGVSPFEINVPKENGMTQLTVYPAAVLRYQGKELAVNLLSSGGAMSQQSLNDDAENLEYALVSGIRKLLADGKPLIGISEGHGELSDDELFDAMNSLASGYDVRRVNLSEVSTEGLRKMKLLLIAKPQTAFSEAEKYKIDWFVMNGGRVLWSIDNVTADLDSMRATGSMVTMPKKLNLDDLLFTYGARINYELIADMNCAPIPVSTGPAGAQGGMVLRPWLYFPVFTPQTNHPVVRNLQGIRGEFAGTVDTIAVKGIRKQVLLASSAYSRIATSPSTVSLSMVAQEADPAAFKNTALPAVVALEGKFPSAFFGRPMPAGTRQAGPPTDRGASTKMVVIGDGDFFKNRVNPADGSPYPLGYDSYSGRQYANKALLLNLVDYLTDDTGLITLRNREIAIRLLDRARIRESKTFWQALNIGLPILLLMLAGTGQYIYRKRRFGV